MRSSDVSLATKWHMLASLSFFQCFSIPETGAIGWVEEQSIQTAEQRREVGCALCARNVWLEHRYRYLWREPDNPSIGDDLNPEMVLQSPSLQEELGEVCRKALIWERSVLSTYGP